MLDIGSELIEQVVDNLCFEDLDLVHIGVLFRFGKNLHIKHEEAGVLLLTSLRFLEYHILDRFHHIILRHRPNAHIGDRNLGVFEELKKGFQGTQGRGSNTNTCWAQLDALLHLIEIVLQHHFGLCQALLIIHHVQL